MQNVAEILDVSRRCPVEWRHFRLRIETQNPVTLPLSIIIPVKNDSANLSRCLDALRGAGEIYVVDSQSTDTTAQIAESHGAELVQFHYSGGWPKKRQWALDKLPLAFNWVLLLDADEIVTPALVDEIRQAINDSTFKGYYLTLKCIFLDASCDIAEQTSISSRCFAEDKDGSSAGCRTRTVPCATWRSTNTWLSPVARVHCATLWYTGMSGLCRVTFANTISIPTGSPVLTETRGTSTELKPNSFGNQAQRRRWIKRAFFGFPDRRWPCSAIAIFFGSDSLPNARPYLCLSRRCRCFTPKQRCTKHRAAGSKPMCGISGLANLGNRRRWPA